MSSTWRVELSSLWNFLGPFPIHAREQHYLSPAFPLDLSVPVDWSKSWPSSYANNGVVNWSNAHFDPAGDITISFPNIRWASLRATEGWAALQYHAVLHTQLTLYPPAEGQYLPILRIQLNRASFFTITPSCDEQPRAIQTPKWYQGNIYDFNCPIPQNVELPMEPSLKAPTTYNLFISGDYEIRLFGDPRNAGSEDPALSLSLFVEVEEPADMVARTEGQDILCDFVDGMAFGNAIGIGLRSISGWWTVLSVSLFDPPSAEGFGLNLLRETRLAPSQTRVVPLVISQKAPIFSRKLGLFLTVGSGSVKLVLTIVLPIRQLERWNSLNYEPIRSVHLHSTAALTHFVVIPPKYPAEGKYHAPLLALHGAGVDVMHQNFWAEALPRQENSWIVIPTGRTSWGLDWHGPSAQDAWTAVQGLAQTVDHSDYWWTWGFPADMPVIILGHSNGGQGAWYLASRYPDRVLGVVPAAAYIKSQAYVPLTLSRSAHYIDPTLRAVIESSLTPDDNDLHLSNITDIPVYAIHGGDDDNVPVWHTREALSVLKTWALDPDALYREDEGMGHWYPSVFRNEDVKHFLERILREANKAIVPAKFTITTTSPAESGPLHGWRVEQLQIPGRLGRMQIEKLGNDTIRVSTLNICRFSIDRRRCSTSFFIVDGTEIAIKGIVVANNTLWFERSRSKTWGVVRGEDKERIQQSGRLQLILNTTDSITFIVPTKRPSHEFSIALRLAHDLQQFHRLDADILDEKEAGELAHPISGGRNYVIVGNTSMELVHHILSLKKTSFSLEGSILTLNGHSIDLDYSESAAIFLHPPLEGSRGLIMFILSSNAGSLERAMRLFPIRTGVPVPDWIIISKYADNLGAAGIQAAGIWGREWCWNQRGSWVAIELD